MIREDTKTLSPDTLLSARVTTASSRDLAAAHVTQDRVSMTAHETARRELGSGRHPQAEIAEAGARYRFEHLTFPIVLKDLSFSKGDPGPGDLVPAFDLPVVGGGRFRSRDLADDGPVLMIFGSMTCPVTDNAAPGLNELYRRFGSRVRCVMVNVREAHPGTSVPQPTTFAAKAAHAEQMRDLHRFGFEVAVDDIDGTLHRALGPKPNSAYILGADGIIRFRAQWANDTRALSSALAAVVAGTNPRPDTCGGIVKPTVRILANIAPALDRAGSGAWADMWRAAPPLAAVALAFKSLGVRPKRN